MRVCRGLLCHVSISSSVRAVLQARTLEWVPCPSPGDLPDPGAEPAPPATPAPQVDSVPLTHQGSPLMRQ